MHGVMGKGSPKYGIHFPVGGKGPGRCAEGRQNDGDLTYCLHVGVHVMLSFLLSGFRRAHDPNPGPAGHPSPLPTASSIKKNEPILQSIRIIPLYLFRHLSVHSYSKPHDICQAKNAEAGTRRQVKSSSFFPLDIFICSKIDLSRSGAPYGAQ